MNFQAALETMRTGSAVARRIWHPKRNPEFLVFMPGREVQASFEPMVTHLGKGCVFRTRDHIDAVFVSDTGLECVVGYELSQADIMAADWYVIENL
ncbi:Thoeris anti-defense Tad2 family protein [Hartmannibacter diazotrophicus]|nr:MW1434 family type I TA system toxin [Hartmannibacter diazotrophicus]